MWQDPEPRGYSCFFLLVQSCAHSVSVSTAYCMPGTILGIAPQLLSSRNLHTSLSPINEVIYFSDSEPKRHVFSFESRGAPGF